MSKKNNQNTIKSINNFSLLIFGEKVIRTDGKPITFLNSVYYPIILLQILYFAISFIQLFILILSIEGIASLLFISLLSLPFILLYFFYAKNKRLLRTFCTTTNIILLISSFLYYSKFILLHEMFESIYILAELGNILVLTMIPFLLVFSFILYKLTTENWNIPFLIVSNVIYVLIFANFFIISKPFFEFIFNLRQDYELSTIVSTLNILFILIFNLTLSSIKPKWQK